MNLTRPFEQRPGYWRISYSLYVSVLATWTCIVTLLAFRRLYQSREPPYESWEPRQPLAIVIASALLLVFVFALRWFVRRPAIQRIKISNGWWAIEVATTLAFGCVMTFDSLISIGVWGMILIGELLLWRFSNRSGTGDGMHPVIDAVANATWSEVLETEEGSELTQQMNRGVLPSGAEFVRGRIRGRFSGNDRSLQLHVGFCPPLSRIPEVAVEQIDGPTVQVQVGHCQVYGVRVDLRLTTADRSADDVWLEILAREPVADDISTA